MLSCREFVLDAHLWERRIDSWCPLALDALDGGQDGK